MKDFRRSSLLFMTLLLTLFGFVFKLPAWPQKPENANVQKQFNLAQREQTASVETQNLLKQYRATIAEKKLGFEVGYTTAMDKKLEVLAGTRLPDNLPALAEKQNALAEKLLALDTAARDAFNTAHPNVLPEIAWKNKFPRPCGSQSAFDWRKLRKVTPVRDQGDCGSCWDFSALGAFEGSYLLRNGIAIDASEQQILSCSKGGTCGGGWPYLVFEYLISTGTATAVSYPYTATDSTCTTSVSLPYRAVAWGYVAPDGGIPTVQAMKKALCQYGPLSVTVYVDGLFQAYTDGVFKDIPSASSPSINHAITLIGWDDSKNAWLIKNSWGTGWGSAAGFGASRGYMWIDYNSNNIGMAAAWVQAQNRRYLLPPEYFKLLPTAKAMPKPMASK